jgi:hypothetical protein
MARMLPRILVVTLGFFLVACGGSTDSDSSGSGGSSTGGSGGASTGGTGASSGSGGGGGCTSLVPCCDASGNPVNHQCQNGMPVCPPGASFPSAGFCTPSTSGACNPATPCSATEYCDYPDNLCGTGAEGTCKPKPTGCDFNYAPVCTCDGTIASNECAGYTAGNDIDAENDCPPPTNTFACGNVFCQVGFEYCQRAVSDVGGEPDTYACKPVPDSCGKTPICSCLVNEPCGQWCQSSGLAQLMLTCPGG